MPVVRLCVNENTTAEEAFSATVTCTNPSFTPIGPGNQCTLGIFNVNLAPPTLTFSFNAQFEYEYLQDGFTFNDFCNILGQSASFTVPTSLTSCCGATPSASFTFSCDPASITATPTSVSGSVSALFTATDLCVPTILCVDAFLEVDSVAALLAALNDDAIDGVCLNPDIPLYDLSGFPPATRTTDITLVSVPPGTSVQFNIAQDLTHIIIGPNVTLVIPPGTIFDVNQSMFYPTIAAAIAGADPCDLILVGEGTYNQTAALTIDKCLTIQGASASNTSLVFDNTVNVCLFSMSDDVTLKNLHLVSTFDPLDGGVDNWVLSVPIKAFAVPEVELYNNFTLQDCIIEGGRRSAFIDVVNLTITGCQFIHNGDRNSIQLAALGGTTNITNNSFSGGILSRAVMTFEVSSSFHFIRGAINILNNTAESFSQFTLFNLFDMENIDLLIQGNSMNHMSRSGSSIIFLPTGDFAQFNTLLIQNNTIINPNINRLAVYLDYTFGGTSIPANGQIKVYFNTLNVSMPWGKPTDTVSPIAPVGFSTGAPVGTTLAIFDLVGNTVL